MYYTLMAAMKFIEMHNWNMKDTKEGKEDAITKAQNDLLNGDVVMLPYLEVVTTTYPIKETIDNSNVELRLKLIKMQKIEDNCVVTDLDSQFDVPPTNMDVVEAETNPRLA